jgi:hypothetical protein
MKVEDEAKDEDEGQESREEVMRNLKLGNQLEMKAMVTS